MAFKASVTTVLLSLNLVLFTLVSAQSPPPTPPSPPCPTANLIVCLFQPNKPECCRILAGLGINVRICLCSVLKLKYRRHQYREPPPPQRPQRYS
ncbi:hypothetical protein F3Y22_tig00014370pilonHSYRG00073 [Hibiscus syriacus]|uniref:Hydrophobic seed protein domain-containing protein n=1 Tax=Hibiscus syriacus TaxID=106335 RepID=A0A6A3BZY1_HIBSY|nr:hypothetical protein F3Y22_tig00014370pilonHSYRG00073 [Hibiscus syriacus]